ncbi:hypothetical protein Tco_0833263 [Tanacetum coccineum]
MASSLDESLSSSSPSFHHLPRPLDSQTVLFLDSIILVTPPVLSRESESVTYRGDSVIFLGRVCSLGDGGATGCSGSPSYPSTIARGMPPPILLPITGAPSKAMPGSCGVTEV